MSLKYLILTLEMDTFFPNTHETIIDTHPQYLFTVRDRTNNVYHFGTKEDLFANITTVPKAAIPHIISTMLQGSIDHIPSSYMLIINILTIYQKTM